MDLGITVALAITGEVPEIVGVAVMLVVVASEVDMKTILVVDLLEEAAVDQEQGRTMPVINENENNAVFRLVRSFLKNFNFV